MNFDDTRDEPSRPTPEPADPTLPVQAGDPSSRASRRWRRHTAIALAAIGFLLFLVVAVVIPMPYVIEGPGPTFDVLGEEEGDPIISVEGAPTYPANGQLRMVTVSLRGGPSTHVTGAEVVWALLDPDEAVYPVEDIYPSGASADEIRQMSTAQMTGSQTNAEVAALRQLGYDVPVTLTIAGVREGGPVDGKLAEGDVLTAITVDGERHDLSHDGAALFTTLEATPPGTHVHIDATRDGAEVSVDCVSEAREDGTGSVVGAYLEPHVDLPVQVSISLSDVGGPSAGTMFALGIIDAMTEGDLTGGKTIAGTGAVSMGGGTQMISGVPQKMRGAFDAGARWFLLPTGNCADAAGAVPDGMTIVPVDSLAQARDVVEAIGQDRVDGLPTCPAN